MNGSTSSNSASAQISPLSILVREKTRAFVTPFPNESGSEPEESLPEAREVVYAPDGTFFASIEGEHLGIVLRDGETGESLRSFGGLKDTDTPLKINFMSFSPKGTFLLTWARPVQGVSVPNLVIYKTLTGERTAAFHQKAFHKDFWPSVQWSEDESIAVRAVTNTLHFFPGDKTGEAPTSKIGIPGVTKCELSKGSAPYTIAVFIAGSKGGPGKFALYQHTDQGGEEILNRSTFRADSVTFKWNAQGSSLIALVSTNVDTSGKSYYGQSEVYFMNKRGSVNKRIELPHEGPTYDAAWSPSGDHFIIIYGFMPARATLFDARCDPVFDFGTGSWNTIVFSPHGRYVALGGFGSLAGRVEFWDISQTAVVGRVELPCTTAYSWSPCSRYFLAATTFPRLREGNGYKIARIDGKIIQHVDLKDTLLFESTFRPGIVRNFPDPKSVTDCMIGGPMQKPGSRNTFNTTNGLKKGGVYRPPGSRGAAASFSLHDHVKAGKVDKSTFLVTKPQNPTGLPTVSASGKKIVPGMDPDDVAEAAPSKSALKRRKRKEKEKLALLKKEEEGATPSEKLVDLPEFENLAAAEKRVKALTKKLRQIAGLKASKAEGKELKEDQMAKLSSEAALEAELASIQNVIKSGKLAA